MRKKTPHAVPTCLRKHSKHVGGSSGIMKVVGGTEGSYFCVPILERGIGVHDCSPFAEIISNCK
jgi:hypothetical protein